MKISQLVLDLAKKKQMKGQIDAYERTRQEINRKGGGSAPPASGDKSSVLSRLVGMLPGQSDRTMDNANEMVGRDNDVRGDFLRRIAKGKAYEEGGRFGGFFKDGYYSGSTGPDDIEYEVAVSPDEYKQNYQPTLDIMKSLGAQPDGDDKYAVGDALADYKRRFGDSEIDLMKLKHMIMRPNAPVQIEIDADGPITHRVDGREMGAIGGTSMSPAELARLAQTLPAKKKK